MKQNTKEPPKPIIERIPAEYRFSDPEKLELAKQLAHHNHKLSELEDRKKTLVSEMKGQMELSQANINALSQKITNGFELRDTECVVTFDPASSTKFYHNVRTKEFVKSAEMTQHDFQTCMPFVEKTPDEPFNPAIDVQQICENLKGSPKDSD